eukprot:scaffold216_cov93-Skeletonema_marinoi.AAC.1
MAHLSPRVIVVELLKGWHYNSVAALLPLLVPSAASDDNDDQCRLYLAESTIPGAHPHHSIQQLYLIITAGLGIFTGVNLPSHTPVAEPDIVIPLADYEWHTAMQQDFHLLWVGSALVIGTGCMPNCNFALINAHEGKPEYGHAGLTRNDYGVTGFTGFHNQRMVTDRSIPAGGEIFVNYGEA